jgi:uncharacterized protein (DUF983 family)
MSAILNEMQRASAHYGKQPDAETASLLAHWPSCYRLRTMTENAPPQFATAEYSTTSCNSCGQKISGPFYRVKGAPTCTDCTRRLQQGQPEDSHAAFVRALLCGAGAAVVGFIIYVAFALSTGLVIGYVSLAVGYLVGKAVSFGSRGVGGRRYQISAALMTYMAVSLAAVPIAISVHMKHKNDAPQAQARTSSAATPAVSDSASAAKPKIGFAQAVGTLTLVGLASPFLGLRDPLHGVIGLIILLVGVRIAWQLTAARPPQITGPIPERTATLPG